MKIKTEKLVKPLKKIKALEKQNEIEAQMVKPAVRIQELKNKLIILIKFVTQAKIRCSQSCYETLNVQSLVKRIAAPAGEYMEV